MLMLMAIRHAKSVVCRAEVHDYRLHEVRGRELRDLTVGVIGTGTHRRGGHGPAAGLRVPGRGARPAAQERRRVPPAARRTAALSDIVTLHTPLNAGTHHLLDRQRIERMKPGALIVNTGRGALMDTEALVPALQSGRLGGAALDVIEGEEGIFYADCRNRPIESKALLRLQEMPNVLISPHTAYYTDHALRDTIEHSITNCLEFEKREPAWISCTSASSSAAAPKSTRLRQVGAGGRGEPRHRRNTSRSTSGSRSSGAWRLCEGPDEGWDERQHGRAAVLSPDRDVHGLVVLRRAKYETIRLDVVLPVLHGRLGEDGATARTAGALRHPLRRLRHPEFGPVHGQVPHLHGRERCRDRHAELLDRRGRRGRRPRPDHLSRLRETGPLRVVVRRQQGEQQ